MNKVWMIVGVLAGGLLVGSCSGDSDKADGGVGTDLKEVGVGETLTQEVTADLAEMDVADTEGGPVGPRYPFGSETRGWTRLRGIVHLHSAYSHDGCGPDGYEDYGGPDPACISELRAAPCDTGIDFLMMTDHPGYLQDHTHEEGLLYHEGEGDELIKDGQGRNFSNRVSCPEGSLVDDYYIYVGTEGGKHMPIAMAGPVPPQVFGTKYGDEELLENSQAAAAVVHELDGYTFCPHTEESTISVERMIALPLDGMEIYNIHANLMGALESLDTIFEMDSFMEGTVDGPHPDYSMLLFLAEVDKDVEKFQQAAQKIRIAHIAATDIHRNVEIPALCPGGIEGSMCESFAVDYPNFAAFAVKGGPVPLSDGDRVDSYARSLRWMSNWALVKDKDPQMIREAIGEGRSFSAFDMFGFPAGFDFFAMNGDVVVEMGEEVTFAQGMVVALRTPALTAPPWLAGAGLDYTKAQVRTRMLRVTGNSTEILVETYKQGHEFSVNVDGPGLLWVEVKITPVHLTPLLPGAENLAGGLYPYLYTNGIFVR